MEEIEENSYRQEEHNERVIEISYKLHDRWPRHEQAGKRRGCRMMDTDFRLPFHG